MAVESNIRERIYEVDHNFVGWRLDQFLANRMGRLSRSRAGLIARKGDVEIHPHRKIKAATRLRLGDRITVREHLKPEAIQDDEVVVLYEDEALVVVNKPAGMLVHEAGQVRLNTVQGFLDRQGYDGAEPVHRIDRETSGVLICARTREWVGPLRTMFATEHPLKIYRALAADPGGVWDVGAQKTVEIPLRLHTESRLGLRMIRGNLSAVTHIKAVGLADVGGKRIADLEVRIETGRQHQIRAHLDMVGTPIAGDKLYGHTDEFFMAIYDDPENPELRADLMYPRHALHAQRIEFLHPVTRQTIEFRSALPDYWSQLSETSGPEPASE